MSLIQELNELIKQNSDVSNHERLIAEQFQTYVDNNDFYELPIQNILNIVKILSFNDNETAANTITKLITKMNSKYPDQSILLLNVIPYFQFSDEQSLKILSTFKFSPFLSGFTKSLNERSKLPVVDYDYEMKAIIDSINIFDAAKSGSIKIIESKINDGFNVDSTDNKKRTLVHYAAIGNKVETLKYLIENHHCSVDPLDHEKKTPLMKAAKYGCLEAIKYLVSKGANINTYSDYKWYVIHCAAKWGHCDLIRYLVSQGIPVDIREGSLGRTPFLVACERGDIDCADCLLQLGADINAKNDQGFTALHSAVRKNKQAMTLDLIQKGADVNAVSNTKKTPLDTAYLAKSSDCIPILKSADALTFKQLKH